MKFPYLKSGIFSLGVILVLGIISCFFGYVYSIERQRSSTSNLSIPHVYYSVKTITSIDPQGNSLGTESIYRTDGMAGQPVKVADLPTGVTGASWASSTIQYDVYSSGQDSPKKFHATLDSQGNKVWNNPEDFKSGWGDTKDQVLFRTQWIHPDGTYVAISEIYCSDTTKEGPCDQSFRFTVTNLKTGQQKTYTAKTFDVADGQAVVSVLHQDSATTAYVQISNLQDPGTAFIGVFDFSAGKVIRTLYRGTSTPVYSYQNYEYLRLSDDQESIYIIQWYADAMGNKEVISIDVQTGAVKVIMPPTELRDYAWPTGSPFFYYKKTDDTIIRRNIVSGEESTFPWSDTVDAYIHPRRFIAKNETSSGGVYYGKLIITDTLTKQQRVIYDQLRDENAYGGNVNGVPNERDAKIGDPVYQFMGIEQ